MYCPTIPPLGHIWGHSGDLTQPNVKCPIVGQTYRVNSPCKAPLTPEGGGGGGGWGNTSIGALLEQALMSEPVYALTHMT